MTEYGNGTGSEQIIMMLCHLYLYMCLLIICTETYKLCKDVFYMEEYDLNQEIQLKKRTVYSYYT